MSVERIAHGIFTNDGSVAAKFVIVLHQRETESDMLADTSDGIGMEAREVPRQRGVSTRAGAFSHSILDSSVEGLLLHCRSRGWCRHPAYRRMPSSNIPQTTSK
jgi:hypothetical protein